MISHRFALAGAPAPERLRKDRKRGPYDHRVSDNEVLSVLLATPRDHYFRAGAGTCAAIPRPAPSDADLSLFMRAY